MAETNEPVPTEEAKAADLPLEARLRALGLGGKGADSDPDPLLAAFAAQLATLSAGLAAHRDRMRDVEKSLVERIADVDDDRRLTAVQLQRAWQTQREEQEARLRRRSRAGMAVLALIAVLGAGGLFALYRQVQSVRAGLDAQTAALGPALERLAGSATRDLLVEEKLRDLSGALAGLARSVERGADARAAPAEATTADAPLAALVERVESEQARLAGELAALRRSLAERPPVAADAAPESPPRPPPLPDLPDPTVAAPADAPPPVAEGTADAPPAGRAGATVVAGHPFALQLMGSFRREAVLDLATRRDLPAQVFVRQESLRGRPWFVLIHSLHPSRADAQVALDGLPPDLLAIKPWVRSLPPDADLEIVAAGTSR